MLPKNIIATIVEQYIFTPSCLEETKRGMKEFFDLANVREAEEIDFSIEEVALFSDWLIYDYIASNGRTFLENFITDNPLKLNPSAMSVYQDLLSNYCGVFEVKHVIRGQSFVLENVQNGEKQEISEPLATLDMEEDDVFFGRLAEVGGRCELVGSAGISMPKLHPGTRRFFRAIELKIGPKMMRDVIHNFL